MQIKIFKTEAELTGNNNSNVSQKTCQKTEKVKYFLKNTFMTL